MAGEYLRALISATSKDEAEKILKTLLEKKLVSGGFIFGGDSRHWWKGKIDEEPYYNISAFAVKRNKDEIIRTVEELSKDEVPLVLFFKIDYGNKSFLEWIEKNSR